MNNPALTEIQNPKGRKFTSNSIPQEKEEGKKGGKKHGLVKKYQ